MIPTPHIEARSKDVFAKTVLMPGDPLRAEFIAKTYLENVEKVNNVRNMFAFTGYYKGKKVTVMGSGMGMPSIGIYSYELFKFYDVDTIIRVGSCGSYTESAKIYDVIVVNEAYSESSYAKVAFNYQENILESTKNVVDELNDAAKRLNIDVINSRIHSSDVFYRHHGDVFVDVRDKYNCVAVEMESFALFANAKYLGKNAGCILTVSDSLVTHEATTSEERQKSFNKMMEIALEAVK
ncbi:MAG TPA: purine-nucleoside phosphorylase [Acholeplasmataceae bacterium]|jgi:purine-nucleoside phosphorylase|nr:purine-nucleoside phosphorylase [Acholeplasmataceae bacterium]